MTARHLSVTIARTPGEVYRFAAKAENLPRWAAGLARSEVRPEGDQWVADSPLGEVRIRFAPRNSYGVLDHEVTTEAGQTFYNPMRVVPNGPHAEVIFTLYRRPEMSDEEWGADQAAVEKDLHQLRELLQEATQRKEE